MRTRLMIPALLAVISLAILAFFALNPTNSVSAQQILERATAVQSAAAPTQGIWHTRIEYYQNFQPLGDEKAAAKTTIDSYYHVATGQFRSTTQDAEGKLVDAHASDGSFTYSTNGPVNGQPIIYRVPVSQDYLRKVESGRAAASASTDDPAAAEKELFEQFRSNPRVVLEGKETRIDGSQAYILVDRGYQTKKALNGQEEKLYTGSVKMIFSADTYRLLESQTSIHKDGQDIIISAARFLVNEVLPVESSIAWDLSDLQNVTIVDQQNTEQDSSQSEVVQFETLSEHELASRANAYVLKNIPGGFTLEIVAAANQPKDEPYRYEVNYANNNGQYFGLQAVGVMDLGFVETNFYDGSYQTASGWVLHYNTASSSEPGKEHTSAILILPDGNSFLVTASMTREQVQTLVEDLVPAK